MSERDKIRRFKEKHPPLTDEQIKEREEDHDNAKKSYARDMSNIEANLIEYFDRPLVVIDPMTNKAIALIRKPSIGEIEAMSPPEEITYTDEELEGLPLEEKMEISKQMLEFAKNRWNAIHGLIIKPEKPLEWWKSKSTDFLGLVQDTINVYLVTEAQKSENFPKAPKDRR